MNRTIAPAITQPQRLDIEFPEKIELQNGVNLFWVKDVKDNSVKLDIEWKAGSKYQSKKLTASLTNNLLLSGYEGKSATAIAEEIDFYGGFVQREMDRDHAGLTLFGLAENMEQIFGVFSDAFQRVSFPENQFEKERSIMLSRFKIDSKKVKTQCRRRFNTAIFGEASPYGHIAEEVDFKEIQRKDIIAFHEQFYIQTKPTIFLVGNVEQSLIAALDNWSGQFVKDKQPTELPAAIQENGRINVPVKDAIQTAIRVGRQLFDKNHPDYFKFQLLNTALGGYFGSRLMMNIREDKGYTYGIGSAASVMEDAAYFFIATEVATDVKEATITEIFKEIDRLRTEPIAAEELSKVKNYMLGDFLRHADGPIAMMENFKNIHFNKLKPTYYTDFIRAVNEATAEELMEVANNYFKREDFVVVTAG